MLDPDLGMTLFQLLHHSCQYEKLILIPRLLCSQFKI